MGICGGVGTKEMLCSIFKRMVLERVMDGFTRTYLKKKVFHVSGFSSG